MITHEYNGLLSNVKDYKNLGEDILRLQENHVLRKRIIQNATQVVKEKFSKELTAQKTLEVYMGILS